MNHNSIGRGYETFGNGTAETLQWTLTPGRNLARVVSRIACAVARRSSGRRATTSTTTRPAALAALDMAATQSKMLLRSFYRKGFNSWRKGVEEPPYAFAIAQDQGDPLRVAQLIARLQSQHIEVHRSNAAFTVKEGSFGAGTYLVRLDQPYRNYAVDLLAPQDFPKNGGEPYDDVSWELPAHYHVDGSRDRRSDDQRRRRRGADRSAAASRQGRGQRTGVRDEGHRPGRPARSALSTGEVQDRNRGARVQGRRHRLSRGLVDPARAGRARQRAAGSRQRMLALDFDSVAARPDVARHAAKAPRLGVWVPWADTDSIGWLRHTLDERNVPYSYVRDEDIRAGNLRDEVRRAALRSRRPRAGRADPRAAESVGPDALQEDEADAEPRHARVVRRHHRRHRLGRTRADPEASSRAAACWSRSAAASMLALEGGIVRGVRRDSGGVPRSAQRRR